MINKGFCKALNVVHHVGNVIVNVMKVIYDSAGNYCTQRRNQSDEDKIQNCNHRRNFNSALQRETTHVESTIRIPQIV